MLETKEKRDSSVYPYPKRASELVQDKDFLQEISPIELTEKERNQLRIFEEPFFVELKRLKKIPVSDHVIYPAAFTTEAGSRLFSAVYFDKGLKTRIERLVKENIIDWEKLEKKRRVHGAFFDDLLALTSEESSFLEYCEDGVVFPKFQKVLSLEIPPKLKGNIPRVSDKDNESVFDVRFIEKIFIETDLNNIPKRVRERMSRYSSDWGKEKFKDEFIKAGGDVSEIENPQRIARTVSSNNLTEKLQGYRDLKSDLKKVRQQLRAEPGSITEAKQIILDLYQRYVNVLIAEQYAKGRISTTQPRRNRFTPEKASRTLERLDHFLQGTGVKVGDKGLFVTIPEKLSEYARTRAIELPSEETKEYKKYNNYKVNAQQAKVLCEVVLQEYGFAEGDKKWRAVVLERKGTLAINKKEREIKIPKSFKRGLVDTMAVLAHEVEGHVLRHVNREESFGDGIMLIEELSTGRAGILSEAAAMRIEDDTKQTMTGTKKEGLPYYYLTLLEKRSGGSFKECFRVFLEAYIKRTSDMSLEETFRDKKKYEKTFNYVYPRVLRIFRKNTPLNDRTGFLPISSQMQYIEQELVVDILKERGLSKLLHVAGIDLYSIQELRRLGMLDLSKTRKPEMIFAEEIWPKLKESLDEGVNLDEAIEKLRNPL